MKVPKIKIKKMAKQNLIVFSQGMKRRYLAEAARIDQRNIETALNQKTTDAEITLVNVLGSHNFDGWGYKPNTPIDYLAIKCGHIDLIAGAPELDQDIYTEGLERTEIPIRFGLLPFRHGLVGELKFPASEITGNDAEKLDYVKARLEQKNFVPFYNPRQPPNPNRPDQEKSEYTDLFRGTQFEGNVPNKILLNRTMHTVNSKAIWTPYEER